MENIDDVSFITNFEQYASLNGLLKKLTECRLFTKKDFESEMGEFIKYTEDFFDRVVKPIEYQLNVKINKS